MIINCVLRLEYFFACFEVSSILVAVSYSVGYDTTKRLPVGKLSLCFCCRRFIISFMKNAVLSEIFEQMADIMEILGDDVFRINSYRRVARVIGDLPSDVEIMLEKGDLTKIPGVGKSRTYATILMSNI